MTVHHAKHRRSNYRDIAESMQMPIRESMSLNRFSTYMLNGHAYLVLCQTQSVLKSDVLDDAYARTEYLFIVNMHFREYGG